VSAERLKSYRFATPAQWQSGLFRRGEAGKLGFHPFGRLADKGSREWQGDARTPAITRQGTVFWVGGGRLHWQDAGAEGSCAVSAPDGVMHARRLIAWGKWLWTLNIGRAHVATEGFVARYFAHNLQEAERIPLADVWGAAPQRSRNAWCDITSDGHDGVWVLIGSRQRAYRLQPGRKDASASIDSPEGATQLSTQARGEIIVFLVQERGHARLSFHRSDGSHSSVILSELVRSFNPILLGGNGDDRLLIVGDAENLPNDDEPAPAFVRKRLYRLLLVLDSSGGLVDYLQIERPVDGSGPNGIAGSRTDRNAGFCPDVWIADGRGLTRYAVGGVSGTRIVQGEFVTPALLSPEGRERGWLRAELTANLPAGDTISVQYASTRDDGLKARLETIANDASVPGSTRLRRVVGGLDWSEPVTFRGAATTSGPYDQDSEIPAPALIVPLHPAAGRWLWLRIIVRGSGEGAPAVSELRVCYPDLSLTRHLPAIYRGKGDVDGFLRRIVAVLEATTQDLDQRIERIAALMDPAEAPAEWLHFMAGWLGLPWHEALAEPMKRALLRAAGRLHASRGTRAGILDLLRALLPGRRVRILDPAVDLAPAMVGAAASGGTRLPVVLLARPHRSAWLGETHAVLGRLRLPFKDDVARPFDALAGPLRIEIAASEPERRHLSPILLGLLRDFVPAGAHVILRWRPQAGLGTGRRLDGDFVLAGPQPTTLGRDAVVGRDILAREGAGRLRPDGLSTGFDLQ